MEMFKSRTSGPAPWILFAYPHVFKEHTKRITKLSELKDNIAISFELMVLLAQPQPNWALLLKVPLLFNLLLYNDLIFFSNRVFRITVFQIKLYFKCSLFYLLEHKHILI